MAISLSFPFSENVDFPFIQKNIFQWHLLMLFLMRFLWFLVWQIILLKPGHFGYYVMRLHLISTFYFNWLLLKLLWQGKCVLFCCCRMGVKSRLSIQPPLMPRWGDSSLLLGGCGSSNSLPLMPLQRWGSFLLPAWSSLTSTVGWDGGAWVPSCSLVRMEF